VAAVVTLSRGIAAGLAAGLLIAMYLLNIVAQVQPDLAWLGDALDGSVCRYGCVFTCDPEWDADAAKKWLKVIPRVLLVPQRT